MKRLDLVVGPNGAGKSTFIALTLAPLLPRCVVAETVFSHRSKLDLIRAAHGAGYVVALHVLMVPENLAVERVARRVRHGGHDVPEDKIRERHRRLWPLVASAIEIADTATVYDNSRRDGPRIVAQMTAATVIGSPTWPAWTAEALRAFSGD